MRAQGDIYIEMSKMTQISENETSPTLRVGDVSFSD
jgi:hypothetical protein